MPETESTPESTRPTRPALPAGWAEKTDEILVKKPVYLRQWFRRLALIVGLFTVAVGIVGGLFLYRWHREQQADLARQRRGVEAFVRSPAFEAFAREADAQLVAALNFATLRPGPVGALLPDIAAAEKAQRQIPWPLELSPLPVSTSKNPARVQTAIHAATDLLAQRGLAFDRTRITDARRVFLRMLSPHVRTFLAENTGTAFPALFLDRRMQDIVLNAYAARGGAMLEQVERAFVFYALIGPVLWQEIERPGRAASTGR